LPLIHNNTKILGTFLGEVHEMGDIPQAPLPGEKASAAAPDKRYL